MIEAIKRTANQFVSTGVSRLSLPLMLLIIRDDQRRAHFQLPPSLARVLERIMLIPNGGCVGELAAFW